MIVCCIVSLVSIVDLYIETKTKREALARCYVFQHSHFPAEGSLSQNNFHTLNTSEYSRECRESTLSSVTLHTELFEIMSKCLILYIEYV